MSEETLWQKQSRNNPQQAKNYIQAFATLRTAGKDLHGEARFVDALLQRNARVLDAGCGTGRVGGELARRSHRVTGIDLDVELLTQAREDFPDSRWVHQDLSTFELNDNDLEPEVFEAIICTGNVLPFLAPGTSEAVVQNLARHLAEDGRLVIGFSLEKTYSLIQFEKDLEAAQLGFVARFSTWDMREFSEDSDFIVALLSRNAH
ncbi:SAM-dependent methyltransferase [Arthrobacter sp. MYb227]|uniref:class I SAM-dependent methyltransferase n=1 Tax=Arthrobacter sp. MYb227 TaxID=1848601 RepID=UPI000CFAB70F|nr:class I SAM-dependent methyltransferase [Arthrobacter sp. MYb227]PQZ96497.1 SAM-dependent methyltransferase [Arthrobacter sp. MYb227]